MIAQLHLPTLTKALVVVQVTTVGYGDITPQTWPETVVTMVTFFIGVLFFGIMIGSISSMLQRASKSARRAQLYRDKMDSVNKWLHARKLPSHLRHKVQQYYAEVGTPRHHHLMPLAAPQSLRPLHLTLVYGASPRACNTHEGQSCPVDALRGGLNLPKSRSNHTLTATLCLLPAPPRCG